MKSRIRVLVVDDSLTVRRYICDLLARQPDFQVVGEAEDGRAAIALCQQLRPDVITLDMMLPLMSGLAATEYIMAHCPTPILIVSASTNRGELFKTYEALAAGAVDVFEKPREGQEDAEWGARFVSLLRVVSRIKVITHPRARLGAFGRAPDAPGPPILPAPAGKRRRLVAIGASTGGPSALVEILRALPPDFPLPVLIVLHIDQPFGAGFADWLDGQSVHRVAYPRDGDPLTPARVVIAPPGHHLVVRGGRLHLTDDAEHLSCRPSVDVLFHSLAADQGAATVACLLTGMGRDGAAGLLALRRAGALTIAQDEASSVVYGMPREAVLLGAAERELALSQIGPALAALAAPKEGR